jgi:hypothetical protein
MPEKRAHLPPFFVVLHIITHILEKNYIFEISPKKNPLFFIVSLWASGTLLSEKVF